MRAEHHRHLAAAQLAQKVAHHAPADGVERARGLVEHQQPRRAHQRLGDPEPLLHPLRHGGDLHVSRASSRPTSSSSSRALGGAAVRAGEVLVERDQLVGGEPVGEAEQLGEVADRRSRGRRPGRGPLDLRAAARGAHEPAGDLRERGLAGAVRAEQAEQLAALDLRDPRRRAPRWRRSASRATSQERTAGTGRSVGSCPGVAHRRGPRGVPLDCRERALRVDRPRPAGGARGPDRGLPDAGLRRGPARRRGRLRARRSTRSTSGRAGFRRCGSGRGMSGYFTVAASLGRSLAVRWAVVGCRTTGIEGGGRCRRCSARSRTTS